jgi:hypothetical protein
MKQRLYREVRAAAANRWSWKTIATGEVRFLGSAEIMSLKVETRTPVSLRVAASPLLSRKKFNAKLIRVEERQQINQGSGSV